MCHTSWTSQDVARAVGWPCPAQCYEFGRDFVTVFIMRQQTGKPAWVFFFLFKRWPIQRSEKSKNDDVFFVGFPFVCTCGSNTRSKFQIELLKIERGIAEIMTFTIFTILLAFSMEPFRGCISWWVMKWVMQLTSIVSSCLQHCLNFHLDLDRRFLELL